MIERLGVSRETADRLDTFTDLLVRWTSAVNLVSAATLPSLWTRHILDSAQLLWLARPEARTWRDIGSGGGFPGVVVAIVASETRPDLRMTLVESDQRKAAFLAAAARETGIALTLLTDREEALPVAPADVVSARAVASLGTLLGWAARHLGSTGQALFPKGAGYHAELDAALASWRFRVQKHDSISGGGGVILDIDQLCPVPCDHAPTPGGTRPK